MKMKWQICAYFFNDQVGEAQLHFAIYDAMSSTNGNILFERHTSHVGTMYRQSSMRWNRESWIARPYVITLCHANCKKSFTWVSFLQPRRDIFSDFTFCTGAVAVGKIATCLGILSPFQKFIVIISPPFANQHLQSRWCLFHCKISIPKYGLKRTSSHVVFFWRFMKWFVFCNANLDNSLFLYCYFGNKLES